LPLYLDENIQRMTMNLRSNFTRLADALVREKKTDSAKTVLDYCQKVFPENNVPYNIFMIRFPEVYYASGDKESAQFLIRELLHVYEQELRYNTTSVARHRDPGSRRATQQAIAVMYELERISRFYKDEPTAELVKEKLSSLQHFVR
jgi:hypothetical protein